MTFMSAPHGLWSYDRFSLRKATMLDLTPLTKALTTLEEALDAYQKDPKNTFIRDACIQRFEYSYELSHKMLRRYLEMTEPTTTTVNDSSFPSLIRLGYERGLVDGEWALWKGFRDARNSTSHTYDEKKALGVLAVIPDFLNEAKHLAYTIQKRQESRA